MKYITCLLVGTLLSAYTTAEAADTKIVVNPVQPTQRTLFPLTDVRLGDSQFKDIQELDHAYLLSLEPERLLSWFRREAGLAPDAPAYPFWESEDVWGGGPLAGHIMGFSLSSMSMMYEATGDEALKRKIEKMVRGLKECQDAQGDGYLLATINGRRIFEEVVSGKFTTNNPTINGVWEPVYIMNKIMLGLYNAYLSCDLPQAKDVLVKMADWFGYQVLDKLSYEQIQELLVCEHGSINESYITVYEITGDEKYLKWAKLLNDEDMLIPAAEERDVLNGWHANTQIPKFTGFEKVYNYTQEDKYTRAAQFFWETVVDKHTWVIGGNSTGEHFFPVDQFEKRVPSDGGPESCNSVNMMRLTETLYQDYGRMKMVDYYERVLYNHILANYDPHEGMCTYYTPLISGGKKGYLSPFQSFCCCSGSGMENHVKYGDFIYSEGSDSSLWVNLFIPSQLNWTDRKMIVTQDTDIPSSDKTVLTVKTEKPQSVIFRLRYPEWAESMRIKVNGSSVSFEASNNSYVSIEREWKDNDKIEITFKIKFYTVSMPDNEKRVGIFYGPVLLAGELGAEEPDMEKDIPVLVTNNQPVDKWLEKVSDSPLRFKTKGVGEPKDMSLIPFYGMHHQHYMVYWDLFTTEEWKDMQEAYKNELKRLQDLDKITVDYVTLGEMQPERDHNFRGEGIGNGVSHRKKWRAAWIGGWFEFDMKVLPDVPQDLHVTYWGGETAHLEFDIYVDGKVLARQHLYQNKPNQFFEGVYSLPEHFWKGKEKITIRFKGVPGNWTGAIYNARIAKHE